MSWRAGNLLDCLRRDFCPPGSLSYFLKDCPDGNFTVLFPVSEQSKPQTCSSHPPQGTPCFSDTLHPFPGFLFSSSTSCVPSLSSLSPAAFPDLSWVASLFSLILPVRSCTVTSRLIPFLLLKSPTPFDVKALDYLSILCHSPSTLDHLSCI